MAFEFDFIPDNTRDCIIETENGLRDLIDAVLKRKYGSRWEDDPQIGWSNKKKTELENRRKEKKAKFPYQGLSQRLIDYSYIHDLKYLVSKNESLFKPIFSSLDETIFMFDILAKFRNNVMHNKNVIMKHQHYLCLGICGEFLLVIHNWKTRYSKDIESYSCNFRFEELEGTNADAAKMRCLENAQKWLRSIKGQAIKEVKIEQDSSYGQMYIIQLRQGEIAVSSPINSRQYYGVYTRSANVYLTSRSKNAIDRILELGQLYWTFSWILSNELDVSSIISKIEDIKGIKPGSGSSINGEITNASYYIANVKGNRIRVDISKDMNQRTKITLVNDAGNPNSGFINAHKVFSPDIILSILYGEIQKSEIDDLVRKSCQYVS